ncbi:AAA family ATPase [Leucobacter allii]|uniref:AAA family ATPase n=1 Tax=Leucobacter allii TaxID=2932247 RepID=A0ABY4FQX9_9MICO|nr:AAA family ATPase [Leucobacter allii]UOQ58681.1 AAA family ATPase [Leucobacter allii]UOR03207.1 AAA family ATPase [Leucobacter allii]
MLPFDADPLLVEASALRDAAARVRRAAASDRAASGRDAEAEASAIAHDAERREIAARLASLLADPHARRLVDAELDERARALRVAVDALRRRARSAQRERAADRLLARAISGGRALTGAERDRVAELRAPEPDALDGVHSAERRDRLLAILGAARLREARGQLRDGLLLTAQMRRIVAEAVPALLQGEPVLLLGETGGAKTALAEHLSRRGAGREPEFVSGYGDITGAQLLGAHELRAEAGATVSAFVPGPLLRAMSEGRPIILDEINAMPAEFLKRLNRILQLRPGDRYGVQEDGGRAVRVARGFAILATANEQTPHRYRGLERLSAELVNRFGANAYRVHYPDAGLPYERFPAENALIIAAAVADARGALPETLPYPQIVRLARAAFVSQQVFAGAHGEGFADFVSTEREIDGRPGLEESVLAPRTVVALARKVAGSAGTITLDHALHRFVDGVMHREDRRVLALIIAGQGFRLSG